MLPRVVFLTSMIASVALLAGCGHKASHAPEIAAPSTTAAGEPGEHDACSLLDPKEVEAVLGAPLATPPFLRNGDCVYEDAGFHTIIVEVGWSGGAMVWKMFGSVAAMTNQGPTKGMLHLADGSDIAGEWDEARVMTCCTFQTLRGDQAVNVDVGGTASVTIRQAAQLADAALKRIDKPLAIDGDKGVQAARDYEAAHRPKRTDPCAILTRAEAEALMGPLTGEPTSKGDSCTYHRPGAGDSESAELTVQWTGGFHQLRENISLVGGFAKGFASSISGLSPQATKDVEKTLAGAPATANPVWELSGPTAGPRGFSAVKRDVMVSIVSYGLKQEDMEKVVAQVMAKV